ncbi:hypothetical protein Pyn_07937 [Prunus yedoensis var. nudiflora]|uniref:Uncharacterized protein n=1 Tax=Prunus yedoensis var. nudiflora TaxID=2094558 RepID=A0A314Z5V2_PRUYE|nr:hypothetical protein Pyn_07937 [Prunus yedoensis var. nudiflora]
MAVSGNINVGCGDVMMVCIGFAHEAVWMMATRIGRKEIQRNRLWMEPHLRLWGRGEEVWSRPWGRAGEDWCSQPGGREVEP